MSQAGPRVQFDMGQLVAASWDIFKNNLGPYLGAFVVMYALMAAGGMVFYVGGFIIGGPLMLGLYAMSLAGARRRNVEFSDVFSGFKKFLPAFLTYLLTTIFTGIGAMFCLVPGILIALLYMPVYLFIQDQELDFWDAMEASRKMVMNNFGSWLLLGVVLFLLNCAGVLLCCVGTLVTGPMTFIIVSLAYDQEMAAARPASPLE